MENMENRPLVSVIMPCYNHEKYVAQSIESVLNQTYDNFELIVLDNGSTDRSFEVIKQYEGRIRILHVDKNAIFRSEEMLIKNTLGEYVANMTSDDIWKPDKLEKQMKVFMENPEIKACFTWAEEINEDLDLCNYTQNLFMQHNRSRYEWMERLIIGGNCLSFPSSVIEKEVYTDVVRRRLPFRQLSDLYEWLLILLKYDIHVVEEPLVQFRWHMVGENRNESAPTASISIRTFNENAILFEDIIESMDDDVFMKSFKNYFVNREASSPAELMCEKYFLTMIRGSEEAYGQLAIDFFYRQSKYTKQIWGCDMGQLLEKYYGYSFSDFADYSGKAGSGSIVLMQKQIERFKRTIQEQETQIKVLQNVISARAGKGNDDFIYRRSIFEQLPKEQKELIKLLKEYIENILLKVEALSDIELAGEYKNVTDEIRKVQGNLQYLLEKTELRYDNGIDTTECRQFMSVMEQDVMKGEEFINVVLSFLIKVYSVFRQYIGEV